MATKAKTKEPAPLDGLSVWDAYNSAGAPVCIACPDDDGLSVSLFLEGNVIRGVEVCDEKGDIVARAGWLPASVIDEA